MIKTSILKLFLNFFVNWGSFFPSHWILVYQNSFFKRFLILKATRKYNLIKIPWCRVKNNFLHLLVFVNQGFTPPILIFNALVKGTARLYQQVYLGSSRSLNCQLKIVIKGYYKYTPQLIHFKFFDFIFSDQKTRKLKNPNLSKLIMMT